MDIGATGSDKPAALSLLASERPRNVTWKQAAGLLFGDWGTSRLYVLGLAFFFAQQHQLLSHPRDERVDSGRRVGLLEDLPDLSGRRGVYTAAKQKSRILAVIGALLLFADYTVTASLSVTDGFRYFGLPESESAVLDSIRPACGPSSPSHSSACLT